MALAPSRGKLPLKGIYRDGLLRKSPDGFAPDVMGMVVNKFTAVFNTEPGNVQVSNIGITNNLTIIGVKDILYGGKILFSINNNTGLSEIGIQDTNYDYTPVVQQDLGFSIDHPFTPSNMQVEYNFQGDLIVAFSDNFNTPKIVDLTNPPNPFVLSQIELFPSFLNPICISNVLENGGAVPAGVYYPAFRYQNNDGTTTSYAQVNNPVYVVPSNGSTFDSYQGSIGGAATTKALQFTLTNVDTTYDNIVLGLVYKSNGQVSVFEVGQVNTASTVVFTYSGSENTTAIDLAAIIVPPAVYNRIGHLTQVQGTLYGVDVSETPPLDLQQYANLITLKFQSTLLDNQRTLQSSYKVNAQNNQMKGFSHQEVYAFYLIAKLKSGGWTQPVVIPGRAATTIQGSISGNEDDLNSTLIGQDATMTTDIAIDATSKYFQTRDTTRDLDTGTFTGTFGFWENEDEVYPNLDAFNSSGIGGEDLRGLPVRHFRFPSHKKCKETFYDSNSDYGIVQLDVLSIVVDYFPTIPDDILNQIEGFEIMYAERSYANMTVAGNDLVLNGARRQGDNSSTVESNPIYSSGGNWTNNDLSTSSSGISNENIIPYQGFLRLHSFNLLLNKPAISPAYLSNQWKLSYTNINTDHVIQFDNVINEAYEINYTDSGGDATVTDLAHTDEYTFAISQYKYVPNNTLDGQINNYNSESFIYAHLDNGNNRLPYTTNTRYDTSVPVTSSTLTSETTYFTTIMLYRKNIYSSFYNQSLVTTGLYWTVGNTPTQVFGGDIFISLYSFVTFAPITLRDIPNSQKPYSGAISPLQGVKVVRAFLCEGVDNIGFRYEVIGDNTTKYYPQEAVSGGVAWFLNMNITTDPNNITYNKDFSDVNDLNPFTPLNPYAIFESDHPYRIIRSSITPSDQQALSWRTFLANDFYELRKDRGKVTNIQGINFDLLINLETTVLQTIANQTLNVGTQEAGTTEGVATAYVGTGDIFERAPTELMTDSKGFGGCQNSFSCLLTPKGYFFVDVDAKKVFLVDKGLKDITDGIYFFLLENLATTGDNPYLSTGLTVAWDAVYERLVLAQIDVNPFVWSYTPEKESWTGRSPYIPDLLFNDRTGFYSLKGNVMYKHNAPNKCVFYGTVYPSWVVVIDRVLPPKRDPYEPRDPEASSIDQIYIGINWKTEVLLDGMELRDKTIDQLLIFDSYQSSGNITIQAFDTTKNLVQNYGYNCRRIKNRWVLNKFRDLVIDRTQPFIDENFNSIDSNINQNKDFSLKKRFSDDFLAIKFLFTNEFIGILQPDCFLTDAETEHSPIVR